MRGCSPTATDLAQDNAEHLYRFVKDNHPEINAWFVVDRDDHGLAAPRT